MGSCQRAVNWMEADPLYTAHTAQDFPRHVRIPFFQQEGNCFSKGVQCRGLSTYADDTSWLVES